MSDHILDETAYAAVRAEFVLKVDGNRPILFPIDTDDPSIHYLHPVTGLAFSLFDGRRTYAQVRQLFLRLFPDRTADDLDAVLRTVDTRVREASRGQRFGSDGVLEVSDRPIEDAVRYDPREFVLDPDDYIAARGDARTRFRLATPTSALIAFTHRCATRCLYCYAHRPSTAEMGLGRWAELLDEMRELGIHVVSPDNGDTLARREGMTFLEMLIERDFNFLLSTKVHLSRDDVARLVTAGFAEPIRGRIQREVQLSIDAVDDDVSRLILGTARSHSRQNQETFTNFMEFGIMPRVKAVITGLNADQMLPIVETYHRLGARRFTFSRYMRTYHRHRDDLFVREPHLQLIDAQLDVIHEKYPDIEIAGEFHRRGPADEKVPERNREEIWKGRSGCGGGWSCIGVAAGGEAFLCEQMVLQEPYLVGDARTQSIRDIWNGERLLRFIFPSRADFSGAICAGCDEFEECMWARGRCYRDAYFAYGSVYQPPPQCPKNDRAGLVLT